jgi:hypothetical protein
MLNPMIEDLNVRLGPDHARPLLEAGPGLTNFQLSEMCYRAALSVAENEGKRVPAFVKRMIPHSIEKDGNLWRNRGEHLKALHRYLDSLKAWQGVRDWIASPSANEDDTYDKELSRDVTERNEGRVRRKAAELARLLCADPITGESCSFAFLARDWQAVEAELAKPGWEKSHSRGGVVWLDE